MVHLYAGRLLRIHLEKGTWEREEIREEEVRGYLLGSGLAAKIFYQEMEPALDPLDPRSPLLLMDGLLTHPRPSGMAEGVLPDLKLMLKEYYEWRGWTAEGIPREEKLKELGLT